MTQRSLTRICVCRTRIPLHFLPRLSACFRPPLLQESDAMSLLSFDPAVLVLEDGSRHQGNAYGARGTTLGEVVFTTGMTGYQETLTDPSYAGQIVLQTAPHIGITGMNDEDPESRRIWVAGYIVRDPSRVVS